MFFFSRWVRWQPLTPGEAPLFVLERQVPSLDSSKFGWAVGRWFWWPWWCIQKKDISNKMVIFCRQWWYLIAYSMGRCSLGEKGNVSFFWDVLTDFGHYLLVITCEWSLEQTCSGCFGSNVICLCCFTWVTQQLFCSPLEMIFLTPHWWSWEFSHVRPRFIYSEKQGSDIFR